MAKNEIEQKHHQTFEQIKQTNEFEQEFWSARDLQSVLEYSSWDKFKKVIEKAITACKNTDQSIEDHFSHVGKKVSLGSGWGRGVFHHPVNRAFGTICFANYLRFAWR